MMAEDESGYYEDGEHVLETPSTIRVLRASISVLEPTPITLKPSSDNDYTSEPSSSILSQTDLVESLNKKVQAIITEALFYSDDHRAYHPFYLEVQNMISTLKSQGYLGERSGGRIQKIWREFDDIALNFKENGQSDLRMHTELSPYAHFIRSGKASGGEVEEDSRFKKLKSEAERIFDKWKSKDGNDGESTSIRNDLEARLEFFKKCKTITSPPDVVKMNNLWKEFLNGFKDMERNKTSAQIIMDKIKSQEPERYRKKTDANEDEPSTSKVNEELPSLSVEELPSECPHCFTELNSKSTWKDHILSLHLDQCFKCPYLGCKQVIICPNELNAHFSEMHGQSKESPADVRNNFGHDNGTRGRRQDNRELATNSTGIEIINEPCELEDGIGDMSHAPEFLTDALTKQKNQKQGLQIEIKVEVDHPASTFSGQDAECHRHSHRKYSISSNGRSKRRSLREDFPFHPEPKRKRLESKSRFETEGGILPQCYVLVEDISKSPKWASKIKLMLNRSTSIRGNQVNRTKNRAMTMVVKKTIPLKPKSRSSSSKISSWKSRNNFEEQEYKSKTSRKYAKREKRTSNSIEGSEGRKRQPKRNCRRERMPIKIKSRESERVQRYRRRQFEVSYRKKRISLSMICRRRRFWEEERRKRSEKTDMTLEYLLIGQCKLRTLKNRAEWRWKSLKKPAISNPSHFTDLDCPFCSRTSFKKMSSKMIHIKLTHPKDFDKFQVARNRLIWQLQMDLQINKRKKTKSKFSSIPCPYCKFRFRSYHKRLHHLRAVHPDKVVEYENLKRKKNYVKGMEKREEQRRKILETGEGPLFLKRILKLVEENQANSNVCDECGITFTQSHAMKRHKAVVHNNPDLVISNTCPVCLETMFDGPSLWLHFCKEHLDYDFMALSKIKGEMLGFKYQDSVIIEGENAVNDFNFNSANAKSKDDPRLLQLKGKFKCSVCDKEFGNIHVAKRHLKTIHDENEVFTCSYAGSGCSKTFKSKDSLDAHVKQVHEGKYFLCDICSRKFQGPGNLWKHKVDFHKMQDLEPPEGVVISECPYCKERFMRGLPTHVRVKHTEKEEEFLEKQKLEKKKSQSGASKKWKRKQRALWREQGICTSKVIKNQLPPKNCPHCGIECTRKNIGNWADHLRKVHNIVIGSRKFVCPVEGCDKSYLQTAKLKAHSMEHFTLLERLQLGGHVVKERVVDEALRGYRCLVCEMGDVRGVMCNKGEIMIHFVLYHSDLYNRLKGPLEPELENHLVPLMEKVLRNQKEKDGGGLLKLDYKCPHCPAELYSKAVLRDHVLASHPQNCWQCPLPNCMEIMVNPGELDQHFTEVHGMLNQASSSAEC